MTDNQAAVADLGDAPTGRKREIMIVLPGLLLTLIIAMLDQLVVSTALPRIVGDLGGLNHLAWVVTAYILASTITTLRDLIAALEKETGVPGRFKRPLAQIPI